MEQRTHEQGARRAALAMDGVLVAVAGLTMAFSLGNIHQFATAHGTDDPIAYFLAPAVDLALIGALIGDAFLSRLGLDAGPWAKVLRWFAGAATLALNVWESVAARDGAGIVLHAVPPLLLFALAEAAMPYRQQFAAAVRQAAAQVDTPVPTPVAVPAPSPLLAPSKPTICTAHLDIPPVPTAAQDDAQEPARLSTGEAKAVLIQCWRDGVSTREAARLSTRSNSYAAKVFKELDATRGPAALALVKREAVSA